MKIYITEQQLDAITNSVIDGQNPTSPASEEDVDLKNEFGVKNLIRRIEKNYPKEDASKQGLYDSLKLIGSGDIEIKDKDGDTMTYTEMLGDNIMLRVHGYYARSPYYKGYGYQYEFGFYKPKEQSDSHHYFAHGPITLSNYPVIFKFNNDYTNYYSINIISDVCNILKNKLLS